jgi:hypothetical protein
MIRLDQAISFYSDYSHRQFVIDNSLSYLDIEVWFPLIENSYGILSLAQAVVHSSNLYLNVAPAVQAACESRLLESGAMSNYTISFFTYIALFS